jgi:L-lactate dehydrogenase complex protein LldG
VSDARADVLARVRAALGPAPTVPAVERAYRGAGRIGPTGAADVVDRFCARVEEYRATVRRVGADGLAAAAAACFAERGSRRVVVPPTGPLEIEGVDVIADGAGGHVLSARELDGLDAVLTGSALAIAETGTIVLDGGERSGRRALTLIPDHHVCVVEASSIVAGVPDAVAALAGAAAEGRPLTLVSGPSATSDIELDRVEGVHGPRLLDVLVVVSGGEPGPGA